MTFVDTNYFLRFLLSDVDTQHERAVSIFYRGAEGKVVLGTSLIVFFEVYWVLASFYEKQKSELIELLEKILRMEFIEIEERDTLRKALQIFRKESIDLEDSYNVVYAREHGVSEFRTFDKKLAKVFEQQA